MSYAIEPMVAGELGKNVRMDRSVHPPRIENVEYILDGPVEDDLLEAFPAYLISTDLASRLATMNLTGYELGEATMIKSLNYVDVFEGVPHKEYKWLIVTGDSSSDCWIGEDLRLCLSERMMSSLRDVGAVLDAAVIETL
jgi:hypothetical protein